MVMGGGVRRRRQAVAIAGVARRVATATLAAVAATAPAPAALAGAAAAAAPAAAAVAATASLPVRPTSKRVRRTQRARHRPGGRATWLRADGIIVSNDAAGQRVAEPAASRARGGRRLNQQRSFEAPVIDGTRCHNIALPLQPVATRAAAMATVVAVGTGRRI